MKNKKLLIGISAVVLIAVIVALVIVIIKTNGGGDFEKIEKVDPYGFKSEFVDNKEKEYKLSNFPELKNQMLKLEGKILENNLPINKIQFDNWSLTATYYLKKVDTVNNYIKLDMNKDSETGEYKFSYIEAMIFDDSEYGAVKKAMASYAEISDEETKLIDSITEDGIQTMKYQITLDEGKKMMYDYSGNSSEGKEYAYKNLRIYDDPAEDEKETTLYSVKRAERKPTADGKNIDEYGLSFYVPNALKANSYNGMLYTWEFYTGEYVGSYPDGIDVMLKVSGLSEGKDADTYIRNDSRPAKSSGVTPFETKEINGHTWYTCNNGTIYYYGAEFNGNMYEFEIKNGKEYDGVTLQTVTDMLEQTLFFE